MEYLVKSSRGANIISDLENLKIYLSRTYERVAIHDLGTGSLLCSWSPGQKEFALAPDINEAKQTTAEKQLVLINLTMAEKKKKTEAPTGQKICGRCKQTLPLDQFGSGGKASYCKPCNVLASKESRERRENMEAFIAQHPGSTPALSEKAQAKADAEAKRLKANEASRRSKAKAKQKVNG
jgi:hypothetical protein